MFELLNNLRWIKAKVVPLEVYDETLNSGCIIHPFKINII